MDMFGPSPGPYTNRHERKGYEGKGEEKKKTEPIFRQPQTRLPNRTGLGELGAQTSCESNFHIDGWKAGGR